MDLPLKASANNLESTVVQFLIAPGLGLQRITTSQPDAEQLEVSIAALQAALGEDLKEELSGAPEINSEVIVVSA